jgi:hypothetical protein
MADMTNTQVPLAPDISRTRERGTKTSSENTTFSGLSRRFMTVSRGLPRSRTPTVRLSAPRQGDDALVYLPCDSMCSSSLRDMRKPAECLVARFGSRPDSALAIVTSL